MIARPSRSLISDLFLDLVPLSRSLSLFSISVAEISLLGWQASSSAATIVTHLILHSGSAALELQVVCARPGNSFFQASSATLHLPPEQRVLASPAFVQPVRPSPRVPTRLCDPIVQ